MKDPRLVPFDADKAQKVFDAAQAIARQIPSSTPFTKCPVCGGHNKLFYGDPPGRCSICEWEELGIIPLRQATYDRALAEGRTLYEAPL